MKEEDSQREDEPQQAAPREQRHAGSRPHATRPGFRFAHPGYACSSTKHELVHLYPLYPRVSTSVVMIIDDHGGMPGSRKATDDYAAEYRTGWLLNRVDAHVRLVVKPT